MKTDGSHKGDCPIPVSRLRKLPPHTCLAGAEEKIAVSMHTNCHFSDTLLMTRDKIHKDLLQTSEFNALSLELK